MRISKIGKALVATCTVGLLGAIAIPATAHADELTSIIGGTVYDTSGQKMVNKKTNYNYTGKFIAPVDYVITTSGKKATSSDLVKYYYKNKNKGTASVILKGINSKGFKDSLLISYKIGGGSSSSSSKSSGYKSTGSLQISSIPNQVYTGSAIKPTVNVQYGTSRLAASNYTVSYSNNRKVGTATVKVTGKGDYRGKTATINFNIVTGNIANATVSAIDTQKYTGKAITPKPTVTLNGKRLSTSDYTLTYANNQNPGTATITITGKGNYTGTKKVNFTIGTPFTSVIVGAVADQTYTGKIIEPKPKVTMSGKTMTLGTDYTLRYVNNLQPGRATGYVVPAGQYAGAKEVSFNFIIAIDLSNATVSVPKSSLAYTGRAQTQTVTVKLNGNTLPSSAYTTSYANNTNAGTATVTVTGRSSAYYKGSAKTTFKITKIANPMTVTGKTVSLSYNKDKALTISLASAMTVSKAQGTVTYTKTSGNANFTINSKTGVITVKKGTAKNTYTLKFKVSAAGNTNYNAKDITATVKITIK